RVAGGALRLAFKRRHSNCGGFLHGLAPPPHTSGSASEPACGNGHGFSVPGFRSACVSNAGTRTASVDRRSGNLLFANSTAFSNTRRPGLPRGGRGADGAPEIDPSVSFGAVAGVHETGSVSPARLEPGLARDPRGGMEVSVCNSPHECARHNRILAGAGERSGRRRRLPDTAVAS